MKTKKQKFDVVRRCVPASMGRGKFHVYWLMEELWKLLEIQPPIYGMIKLQFINHNQGNSMDGS